MTKKYLSVMIALTSAFLPVGAQAQLIAYEGFGQGTDGEAVAGYSGASSVGLSGSWTTVDGNNSGYTIATSSGGSYTPWGTPHANWPTAESTSWTLTQVEIPLASTLNFTTDGTYYLSYLFQTDQADTGGAVGFINSSDNNELTAGDGYSGGAGKGITAYYGSVLSGGSLQNNADGTTFLNNNWSGQMMQFQAIAEFTRLDGDLSVTLNYYLGSYNADPTPVTTRTIDLGDVSDTFNELTIEASGWNDIDEIYVGDTLPDVTPVPEPSVTALAGLGGLGTIFLLKRKNFAR